ncbi:MAG TPA: hypothetical protein VN282_03790 [Pyrinomonadaceae bacterium]|nr:hypothetical protein [Pyrinomonadaceae bacterium]
MSKLKPARLLLPLALLFAFAHTAAAQTDARRALSALPDSQAVLYVNAHRFIHEVLPRVMPPAEYAKMLAEAQKVGFDPRGLDYVAVVARLADPPPPNNLPEFAVVLRGNFNADTLLALGRVAAGAQNVTTRSETYGSKTLEIIDLQSISKKEWPKDTVVGQGEAKPTPTPTPIPYPEVAVMALDANTLVAGVPSYVKAVVDAAGGRGALKASMVDLAARDPQALWSLTVEPPPVLVDYLHKVGFPNNKEANEMIDWVKQVNFSHGMEALNYTFNASLLTDAPEHASAFSGLIRMGLLAAQTGLSAEAAKQTPKHKDYAQTRAALDAIKTFVNRTEGNTLLLSFSVPQKAVNDLVRKEWAPKKAKPTTSGPARRRARRR